MPFTAQPAEKCVGCGKTVYATEKTVVEEKTDKKIYHKQCIRCSTCNKVLTTGNYSSMDGQFWCKPHFKQLFATKGNYDEAFGKEKVTSKWDNNAAPVSSGPASFIPEQTEAKKESKPTSEATVAKFKQFREQGDADKCTNCGKTVYLAEKLLVEDKNEKRMFHKRCFTCNVCNMTLDLRSYGSFGGKIYCKNHLKEQEAANRKTGSVDTAPKSFIPATEEKKTEKGQTPENIASKFKAAETEKCKSCSKTVYATERVVLPENPKTQSIYHKACLKCSSCGCKLDVSSYGSANGNLYCHTHLKQVGKPEQSQGGYFVSPLANANPDYVPGPQDGDSSRFNSDENENRRETDSASNSRANSFRNEPKQEERESPAVQEPEPEPEREPEPTREPEPEPERTSSPALEKKFSDARIEERSTEDDESKKREDERARKREERKRQQEAEEREAEEERERRKRDRERRLAEANGEASSTTNEESSGESDRDRRRREREEERKREEEEREKQEEKRRKEREDKRKAQEEEMQRELEEQEKQAEERRKKLAELRGDN